MNSNHNVGAGILSIITESLYDKPIVVFREYVQNSIDAFNNFKNEDEISESRIWNKNNSIFFLDNGSGIEREKFKSKMEVIASSEKTRQKNLGYKGIGRLSGLPYCDELIFINILSYKDADFQKFSIDGQRFNKLRRDDEYLKEKTYEEFLEEIQSYTDDMDDTEKDKIANMISPYEHMFNDRNTGFFVILKNINSVLKNLILVERKEKLKEDLEWLLPLPFGKEILDQNYQYSELFNQLSGKDNSTSLVKGYRVYYKQELLERPIKPDILREYVCKKEFSNAICFFTFNKTGINIDKKKMTGMRLYMDNMLLCDESELVPAVFRFSQLGHTERELLQTVLGFGAIIYITDKEAISANARRTFIEVSDQEAFDFIQELALFISQLFEARYRISRYKSLIKKEGKTQDDVIRAQGEVVEALNELVSEKISVTFEENEEKFPDLSVTEKKKRIRRKLLNYMGESIKEYLAQNQEFKYDGVEASFITWLKANK